MDTAEIPTPQLDATAMSLNEAVAAQVRMLMALHRISQRDLAAVTEVPKSRLSRKLRAETPWDVEELVLVATALGITAEELLHRALEMSAPPGIRTQNLRILCPVAEDPHEQLVLELFAPGLRPMSTWSDVDLLRDDAKAEAA